MLDAVTDRDAGSIAGPHPGKPSAKTWAASLIGLGLVAGGVIAGPRLLSSSTPPAVIAPASVAVSVPLRRQVDGRLEVLGQVAPPAPTLLVPDTSGTAGPVGPHHPHRRSQRRRHAKTGPNRRSTRRPPRHPLRARPIRPRNHRRHPRPSRRNRQTTQSADPNRVRLESRARQIMRIAHFFIDHPRFAAVINIFIVVFGLAAMAILPIAQYPNIVPPTIQVTTTYPGASAETVARTVATPLEQAINGVEGMDYISSQSTGNGQLVITTIFKIGHRPECRSAAYSESRSRHAVPPASRGPSPRRSGQEDHPSPHSRRACLFTGRLS